MGTIKPISWISEGKAVHEGTVKLIEIKASKGIKITLDSGKIVWWRCSRTIAEQVYGMYYLPLTLPIVEYNQLILSAWSQTHMSTRLMVQSLNQTVEL